MEQVLPGFIQPSNLVFVISYEGPSFDGKITLNGLAQEISGLQTSLESILRVCRERKVITVSLQDIDLIVEPFEKGSFKQIIRIVPKTIEKYPATTQAAFAAAMIFTSVAQVIATYSTADIKSMTPELAQEIRDDVKLQLLGDGEFLSAIAKVVYPLDQSKDQVKFTDQAQNQYSITYEEKDKFLETGAEDLEFIEEQVETLTGRVTRVDLTATKNALGFKVLDAGITIPCSFLDPIPATERAELLGKWITVTGVTSKHGNERRGIMIYTYEIMPTPEQGIAF